MKFYFAGVIGNPERNEIKLDKYKRLYSYFDLTRVGGGRMITCWKLKKQRLKK